MAGKSIPLQGVVAQKVDRYKKCASIAPAAYAQSASLVARQFGVSEAAINPHRANGKIKWSGDLVRARRVAIYLAMTQHDLTLSTVGYAARMTKEGVRRALHAVEDWRDDPVFDGIVSVLEEQIDQGKAA